jgi:hypothetical protein
MTTEKEETMSTTELIAEARDAADLEVLGEVLRRIYVEAREGVTTPAKARAGLIAVYEAGQRASVTTPTEAGDDKRKELIHVLFDQVPEDWDENDIGILADAIMPLLDATTPTEADDALNFLDEMNSEGRIEYSDYSALHDLISRHPQPATEWEYGHVYYDEAGDPHRYPVPERKFLDHEPDGHRADGSPYWNYEQVRRRKAGPWLRVDPEEA